MKPWIAFLGGALLAGGIALFVTRGSENGPDKSAPPQEAVQKTLDPQPANSTTTAAPAPTSAPTTGFARANVLTPRAKTSSRAPEPVAANTPQSAPSAPTASSPAATPTTSPAATPAAAPAPQTSQSQPAPAAPREPNRVTLDSGTPVIVRLTQTLNSDSTHDGQTFEATLDQPIIAGGFAIAERGARVEGRIIDAEKAGRVKGVSHLSLELTRIHTSDGQRVTIHTQSWEKQGEQTRKQDAEKVAIGAGVGAALGAIFGGGKGAAIGAGSGGAAGTGVVLATRGKPVILPVETKVTFRLSASVTITEK